MTGVNTEAVTRLRDYLILHPEHFDMRSWVSSKEDQTRPTTSDMQGLAVLTEAVTTGEFHCGTKGCIAGLAVAVEAVHADKSGEDLFAFTLDRAGSTGYFADVAEELLGLESNYWFYDSSPPWASLDAYHRELHTDPDTYWRPAALAGESVVIALTALLNGHVQADSEFSTWWGFWRQIHNTL